MFYVFGLLIMVSLVFLVVTVLVAGAIALIQWARRATDIEADLPK